VKPVEEIRLALVYPPFLYLVLQPKSLPRHHFGEVGTEEEGMVETSHELLTDRVRPGPGGKESKLQSYYSNVKSKPPFRRPFTTY